MHLCNFEASLVYLQSSRTANTTQWGCVSKKNIEWQRKTEDQASEKKKLTGLHVLDKGSLMLEVP